MGSLPGTLYDCGSYGSHNGYMVPYQFPFGEKFSATRLLKVARNASQEASNLPRSRFIFMVKKLLFDKQFTIHLGKKIRGEKKSSLE